MRTCLDVIAQHGVVGTTQRRVAAAANVPLGSITYHFANMDELVHTALDEFACSDSRRFVDRLKAAPTPGAATLAVVAIVNERSSGPCRDHLLTYELYTLAARDTGLREVANAWMRRRRRALEQHFDPMTSLIVDALIERLTTQSALAAEPIDPDIVRMMVARATASIGVDDAGK